MDIYWYGQACFKIKGKETTLVIDPYDPDFIGLKAPKDLEADTLLITHDHKDHSNLQSVKSSTGMPMVFNGPGEYEVKGAVITGIDSYHDDEQGVQRGRNIIFHIMIDNLNIVHLGDIGQKKLAEEQVDLISQTDILLIPVGGVYTIDAKTAAEIVAQLEPKIIIPMHYSIPGLNVELESVDNFLKEMGAEGVVVQPKLSITKDKLPDEPQVVLLNKS